MTILSSYRFDSVNKNTMNNTSEISNYEKRYMERLKRHFGLTALQLENMPKKQEVTVESYCKEKEAQKAKAKGQHLALGKTTFEGKPLTIYYTVGR